MSGNTREFVEWIAALLICGAAAFLLIGLASPAIMGTVGPDYIGGFGLFIGFCCPAVAFAWTHFRFHRSV